jgi:hypothetical protein
LDGIGLKEYQDGIRAAEVMSASPGPGGATPWEALSVRGKLSLIQGRTVSGQAPPPDRDLPNRDRLVHSPTDLPDLSHLKLLLMAGSVWSRFADRLAVGWNRS